MPQRESDQGDNPECREQQSGNNHDPWQRTNIHDADPSPGWACGLNQDLDIGRSAGNSFEDK